MREFTLKALLLTFLIGATAGGCTLIAEVDRSQIPTGDGGASGEEESE